MKLRSRVLTMMLTGCHAVAANQLNAWNEAATKQSIATVVEKVTSEDPPEFVPPEERIAVS